MSVEPMISSDGKKNIDAEDIKTRSDTSLSAHMRPMTLLSSEDWSNISMTSIIRVIIDDALFPRAIQGATSINALRNSSCENGDSGKVPSKRRHE